MATETLTHAITVHQPLAWALAAGHKPVENRTWRPGLEHVGRLIGIHAGLSRWEPETRAQFVDRLGRHLTGEEWERATVRGALIGVARLVGVVFERKLEGAWPSYHRLNGTSKAILDPLPADLQARIRPWWRGPWGWLFEEAALLPEPIPMKGQQGLWRIRGWNTDGGSGEFLEEEHPGQVGGWALEQWHKAREEKR